MSRITVEKELNKGWRWFLILIAGMIASTVISVIVNSMYIMPGVMAILFVVFIMAYKNDEKERKEKREEELEKMRKRAQAQT